VLEVARRTLARTLAALERIRYGVGFDPFASGFEDDPYPVYAELRRRDPVHKMLRGPWLVTRYADCEAMLRDPRLSADERNLPTFLRLQARHVRKKVLTQEEADRSPSLLRMDPPEHTRLRRLVSKYFTVRRIGELRPRLEGLAERLMQTCCDRGSMDVVRDLAQPLPFFTIAELIGIPEHDRTQLRSWSDELILTLGPTTQREKLRAIAAQRSFRTYLTSLARLRREAPQLDLVSDLIDAHDSHESLSEHEILETCTLLLVAGHETTTNWIGNAIAQLLAHPDQLEWLRSHPEELGPALEELLRFDPPVQLTSRIALEDIDWNGKQIRRGEEVAIVLAAANRDPEAFESPDDLDLRRPAQRHLSFGAGLHYCMGASLARLECQIAIATWLRRTKDVTLQGPAERRRGMVLRGLRRLPLQLSH